MHPLGATAPQSPNLTPADGRALIPPGGAAGRPQVEGRHVGLLVDERDRVYELRRTAAELRQQSAELYDLADVLEARAWELDRDLRRRRRR